MVNDKPVTVVIADDDDDMRELTADVLTAHGFEARTCASVAAALEVVDADVDVVLTDVRFGAGEAGGLELCRELRMRHPALRIYVLSGDSSVESAALRAGANAFWVKPVAMATIVAAAAGKD